MRTDHYTVVRVMVAITHAHNANLKQLPVHYNNIQSQLALAETQPFQKKPEATTGENVTQHDVSKARNAVSRRTPRSPKMTSCIVQPEKKLDLLGG